ncbi:hypothetical protein HYALB_00012428 [Hymenoscyphus albidus]|uniref:Uncharacterized protein n=1 Tax=Hymenoscyphus albidus TaxID=595503 RepID=A0A9N9Q814_9HELO|nr:hypothetical protein HYALB_00012428 [Hymenoscyphus albidus]
MSDEESGSNYQGPDRFPGLEKDLTGYPYPFPDPELWPKVPESIPPKSAWGMAAIILLVNAAYVALVFDKEPRFEDVQDKGREIIAAISHEMLATLYPTFLETEWKVEPKTVKKLVEDSMDCHERLRTHDFEQTWVILGWYGRHGHFLELLNEKYLQGKPQLTIEKIKDRVYKAETSIREDACLQMHPMDTLLELGFVDSRDQASVRFLQSHQNYKPWDIPDKPQSLKHMFELIPPSLHLTLATFRMCSPVGKCPVIGETKKLDVVAPPHDLSQGSANSEILPPLYFQKRTRKDILEVLVLVEVTVFHWVLDGASSQSFCGA